MGFPGSGAIYVLPYYGTEDPDHYKPGKFCPIYLGDILNDRYVIFRKLGRGSTSTVWLARDKQAPRYVAIKIFGADENEGLSITEPSNHPGQQHVQITLDKFFHQSVNGLHLCQVFEPLGRTLSRVITRTLDLQIGYLEGKLNEYDARKWPVEFARTVCYQIVLGLNYLHSQKIAHRDIYPGNVAFALNYNISSMTMNEIQREIWRPEPAAANNESSEEEDETSEEEVDSSEEEDANSVEEVRNTKDSATDSDAESEASSDGSETDSETRRGQQHHIDVVETRRALSSKLDPGDINADVDSEAWKNGNIKRTAYTISWTIRTDFGPLAPHDAQYLVNPSPLSDKIHIDTAIEDKANIRVLLIDLGFARPFDECPQYELIQPNAYRTPEGLFKLETSWKADIWSLGLLLWETVMVRTLVEWVYTSEPGFGPGKFIHDLAQRLGPVPDGVRGQWSDASSWLDNEGKALKPNIDVNEEPLEPSHYDYGDVRHAAKIARPTDMLDEDMESFVDLIRMIMKWTPEERPTTDQILCHPWFEKLHKKD